MKLVLQREPSLRDATIGEITIGGQHECWTCEDEIRENIYLPVSKWKVPGATAIPSGTYKIAITLSNRFKRNLPILLDVPGFEGIRIHPGNTAEDTEGCILVGRQKGIDSISESKIALGVLQPKIQFALDNGEEVTIEIRNP